MSESTNSSLSSGLDTAAVVSSPESIASETGNAETVVAHNVELPIDVVAHGESDVDPSVPNGGESTQSVDSMIREIPSSTADIPVFEGEIKHDDVQHPTSSDDTTEGTVIKFDLAGSNKETGQNPILSLDNFPDMPLSQARGDQVTDVGCSLFLIHFLFYFISNFFVRGLRLGKLG